MEQRQVRLGDVLDDYCPRDRRVTNHAVVALVGNEIKLTRCSTCDTEHAYKAARVPPRRQTRLVAALSNAGGEGAASAGLALQGSVRPESAVTAPPDPPPSMVGRPAPKVDSVRRPLIRATLERREGAPPPARQAPVFTIREHTGRDGAHDRGGKPARKRRSGGRPSGEPNGNQADGVHSQSVRSGNGKNGSRPSRTRTSGGRAERLNKSASRTRGKSRPQ